MKLDEILPLSGKIAESLSELVETPQAISPIDDHALEDSKTNAIVARKLLSDRRKKILRELAPGITLYSLPQKYFVVDARTLPPKIIYYVKYEIQNLGFISRKAASQVLVWKASGYPATSGLPADIFFERILPKTGTIVTDYQQTPNGKRFWGDRIGTALDSGKFVYYVNFQPLRVIKRISSIDDLRSLDKEIYGGHQKYRQRRVIITDRELPEIGE